MHVIFFYGRFCQFPLLARLLFIHIFPELNQRIALIHYSCFESKKGKENLHN